MIGSKLTALLADRLGTENLLWICILFMVGCFGILRVVWKQRKVVDSGHRPQSRDRGSKRIVPLLKKSRHLRLLTGIIALTVMVSTIVDFQFNKIVRDSFENKNELTSFFGNFFFYLSLISLILQLLFSSRILKRLGVGAAVLFLPVGLLFGSAAIFIQPILWAAIAVKLSDGAFRYSINKSGMELLYLPIPAQIKEKVKAFLDVVGDRFARGIGGGLLYLVYNVLHWPISRISLS